MTPNSQSTLSKFLKDNSKFRHRCYSVIRSATYCDASINFAVCKRDNYKNLVWVKWRFELRQHFISLGATTNAGATTEALVRVRVSAGRGTSLPMEWPICRTIDVSTWFAENSHFISPFYSASRRRPRLIDFPENFVIASTVELRYFILSVTPLHIPE